MVTLDTDFLSAFDSDVEQVAYLCGNKGKQVRKVLERYAPLGMIDTVLAAPPGLSLLAFALYMGRVQEGCAMAQESLLPDNLEAVIAVHSFRFSVMSIDNDQRQYRLRIEMGAVPESMRARQELLVNLAYGVSRIRAMLDRALFDVEALQQSEVFETELFESLYSDSPEKNTPENQALGRSQFLALVNGDFSCLETAPIVLVSLAGILNPKVDEAITAANAEGQRMIDAAFDSISQDDLSLDLRNLSTLSQGNRLQA